MDKEIERYIFILKVGGFWYRDSNSKVSTFWKIVQWLRAVYTLVVTVISLRCLALDKSLFQRIAIVDTMGLLISGIGAIFLLNEDSAYKVVSILKEISKRGLTSSEKSTQLSETEIAWKVFVLHHHSVAMIVIGTTFLPFTLMGINALTDWNINLNFPLPLDPYLSSGEIQPVAAFVLQVLTTCWVFCIYGNNIAVVGVIMMSTSINVSIVKFVKEEIDRVSKSGGVWELSEIIRKHQYCIRLNRAINDHMGLPFAYNNIFYSLLICLSLYNLMLCFASGEWSIACIYGGYLSKIVTVTMIIMYMGEKVKSENEHLFFKMCGMPWYNQPVRTRKDFLFMIKNAMAPMGIDFKGMGALNHETGLNIFNTSYSYFMLLQNS